MTKRTKGGRGCDDICLASNLYQNGYDCSSVGLGASTDLFVVLPRERRAFSRRRSIHRDSYAKMVLLPSG
jgi:hypothetical protein